MAGPQRLVGRLADDVAQHDCLLALDMLEQPLAALEIVADGRQRLVDLVRQGRRHLAQRREARHVRHFRLQFLQPGLGQLLVGQVADEAGEVVFVGQSQFADRQVHGEGRAVLALAHHDTADADDAALAGRQVALEVAVVLLAVRRRHQHPDVPADHFVCHVAKQTLGGRADRFDAAPFVDDDHRIGNRLENRAQPRFGRLQGRFHGGKFL